MPVYDPAHDAPALRSRLKESTGLTIACYCAAWCDTCTQYRIDFNSLADRWPQHTFVWIDIEESPELLDEDDVENFPTVLIQGPSGNLFYGTMLPYISHLTRLIGHMDDRSTPVTDNGPALLQVLLAPAAQ